jgi:hypothetical protein
MPRPVNLEASRSQTPVRPDRCGPGKAGRCQLTFSLPWNRRAAWRGNPNSLAWFLMVVSWWSDANGWALCCSLRAWLRGSRMRGRWCLSIPGTARASTRARFASLESGRCSPHCPTSHQRRTRCRSRSACLRFWQRIRRWK